MHFNKKPCLFGAPSNFDFLTFFLQVLIIACTAFTSARASAEAASDSQQPRDLDLLESRYKVKAKPEPYKPPQPAPNFDDFHPGAQASSSSSSLPKCSTFGSTATAIKPATPSQFSNG